MFHETIPLFKKATHPFLIDRPTVIAMVGLPARGKTYTGRKLARYLNWVGIKTKVFNVGNYRRIVATGASNHNFFRPNNPEAKDIREQSAMLAIADTCDYIEKGGEVAVFDATNTTRERRELLTHHFTKEHPYHLFFVEVICNDLKQIESNVLEVKVDGPDYKGQNQEEAMVDFMQRIEHYRLVYNRLDSPGDEMTPFIQIIDQGRRLVVNNPVGILQSRVLFYLMNVKVMRKPIYMTRHGESVMNRQGKIGGDSDLSEQGLKYAEVLAEYIASENITGLKVWTSYMKRTIQTAQHIDCPKRQWKILNEINAGVCEGMTYEEIQEKYPSEFAQRDKDKFRYRYPSGESYLDLVARLETIIMALEHEENVLIVGHQAVLRCLLAFFENVEHDELPHKQIDLHTVIKLTPTAHGPKVERIRLNVPAVSTHRAKPATHSPQRDPSCVCDSEL